MGDSMAAAKLFQRQVQRAARAGKVFLSLLSDLAELETIAIAIFIAHNSSKFDRTTAKRRRELHLDELSFLQLQNRIQTKSTFGEVMGSSLHHGFGAAVSGDDLDAEIHLKARPLPFGGLPPPRRSCGDLVLHDASQYETAF